MILFKQDWEANPGSAPDFTTTNITWVRMASILKSMGVENHLFLLALHNPDLKGINPHDPNLSNEQIVAIVVECKTNPWYFLREVLKVPAVASPDPVFMRANRLNIAMWWLFFNHITQFDIALRQVGKSISSDAVMVYLLTLGGVNTDMHLLTKDDSLRVKNVQRVKDLISTLPYYLNLKMKGDSNNTEKITINRLGNQYLTSVAQASPKAALNLGRGMTIAINQIDEIAFIKNNEITIPALLAASGESIIV